LHVINQCLFKEVTKSSIGDMNALTALLDDLPVPNAAGHFCPMRSLCFNNCSWLVSSSDVNYCHTRIPHPVAEAIGMKTLRHEMVTGRRLAKPFGQKEPLVRRIKRILTNYPFSEDILKEMLQNADDSGATEIRFIRDGRRLPTKRLFDSTWEALQGPALCIYNNRSFTEADLDGIQNLGEGSKSDDPTKTGQYGVGFNCVYHITDVPTFLTSVENVGTVLCAFDPNCKYVPGADSNNPGGMFDIDDTTRKTFSDVITGYLQEHYDITSSGTVFRLPLRLDSMAANSEISNKPSLRTTVLNMFDTFRTDMGEALLFVNSVEEIHLEEVLSDSDGVRTMYSVFLRLTPEAKEQRKSFQRQVRETASKLHSGKITLKDVREVKEVCYEAIIEDSEKNKEVWQVVQRLGFEDPDVLPKSVIDERRCGNLGCLPIGGVAYLKKSSRNREKHKNRLFCFLPLPVLLEDFPVSVNGHFVLDHESRRNIWTDDKATYKSEWNKCLMEGVIAPAYCTLISCLRDVLRNNEELSKEEGRTLMKQYFDVFPNVQKSTVPYITHLATALYRFIFEENKELLPLFGSAIKLSNLKWMGPAGHPNKKAFFDDLKTQLEEKHSVEHAIYRSTGLVRVTQGSRYHQSNETNSPDIVVRNTLNRCGFILFNCPIRVCEQFEHAEVPVERVNPDAVLKFFGQCGKKVRNAN
jgi:sacsin